MTPADYLKTIITAMHAIEPCAPRGALVSIRDLRVETGLCDDAIVLAITWGRMTHVIATQGTDRLLSTDKVDDWLLIIEEWVVGINLLRNR